MDKGAQTWRPALLGNDLIRQQTMRWLFVGDVSRTSPIPGTIGNKKNARLLRLIAGTDIFGCMGTCYTNMGVGPHGTQVKEIGSTMYIIPEEVSSRSYSDLIPRMNPGPSTPRNTKKDGPI